MGSSNGVHRVSSTLLVVLVLFMIDTVLTSASPGKERDGKPKKPAVFAKVVPKTRYNNGKHHVVVESSAVVTHLGKKSNSGAGRSMGTGGGGSWKSDSGLLPRQGGWGWSPSYGGGGGGSYDVYTIIAVAAFAALFGALIYELLNGNLRRSLDTSTLNLPHIRLGLDSDKFPEVMVKIGDWIANSSWFDELGNNSRSIRDLSSQIGVRKWFEAFKRDPVEYQCIRKMACEALASSPLAAKSLNSNLANVFLTVFGNFIENGDELRDLVNNVVGNPRKCEDFVPGGYCDEN